MDKLRIFFTPLCVQGTKPWAGNTIYEQALGGSEAAVVYLAREFARRGHAVTVFSSGQPGTYDGVTYYNSAQIPADGRGLCDVWISSRWPEILNVTPDGPTKVLWLHDMPNVPSLDVNATKVVVLTWAHARAWNMVSPGNELASNIVIEGDGVDLSLASGRESRDHSRLMWISNPDRGLWIAAKIFVDELLPRWPDLKLDIYGRAEVYGWPERVERPHLPLDETWEKANGAITLHRPLPRLGLMRELMRSWALFYPTYWPETYCMSALEAQAAGTPVITSPVGALPETVVGGIVTDDIVNAVSQLRNRNKWTKLSQAGRAYAEQHSWAQVAVRWERNVFGLGGLG